MKYNPPMISNFYSDDNLQIFGENLEGFKEDVNFKTDLYPYLSEGFCNGIPSKKSADYREQPLPKNFRIVLNKKQNLTILVIENCTFTSMNDEKFLRNLFLLLNEETKALVNRIYFSNCLFTPQFKINQFLILVQADVFFFHCIFNHNIRISIENDYRLFLFYCTIKSKFTLGKSGLSCKSISIRNCFFKKDSEFYVIQKANKSKLKLSIRDTLFSGDVYLNNIIFADEQEITNVAFGGIFDFTDSTFGKNLKLNDISYPANNNDNTYQSRLVLSEALNKSGYYMKAAIIKPEVNAARQRLNTEFMTIEDVKAETGLSFRELQKLQLDFENDRFVAYKGKGKMLRYYKDAVEAYINEDLYKLAAVKNRYKKEILTLIKERQNRSKAHAHDASGHFIKKS